MANIHWSVVVPVRGHSPDLAKLVAAMERQTFPAAEWELLVVDDGSAEPVRLAPGNGFAVKLIRQQPSGPGPARNRGVAAARGEWVAFTAADCEPAPDWLSRLEKAALHSPDTALGGTVRCGLPRSSTAMTSHLIVEHLTSRLNRDPQDARFFTPNNLAVPAKSFRSIGGFGSDYGLGTGEDRDFCARWRASGRRIVAAPEAVVVHTHPLTLRGLLRQQYRYGRGSGIYRRSQQSAGTPVPFESARFYLEAFLAPWRGSAPCENRWVVAALMGASQAINAVGVVRELAAGK
ncbi:MAG: glycosyltransferase [Bryobacterales bacterium]|nr:glycosyltransferase [Bryobacterales bacterium]